MGPLRFQFREMGPGVVVGDAFGDDVQKQMEARMKEIQKQMDDMRREMEEKMRLNRR